ncbi:beta-propeller fold lactonase family protein [Pectobacterium sp. A5351]|uniref:beta-propeller fold lactonase family protein n=1 Tax=Pectobacterium sp. A5351 TaxID=2914983 RepID=UPI00232D6A9B|nr:beta-propeller fold lactonase family protein [Pectobacterium sp. A5351]WCG82454.1 beta-propeller fold lactonase family protein [Pectobacterium sp. A5351]
MTFSRSKSGSGLTRAPRQAWVLEPRMMFDAAAVSTAVDVVAHVAATDTVSGDDATMSQLAVVSSVPAIAGESSALEKDQSLQERYSDVIGRDVMIGVRASAISADGQYLYVVSSLDGGSSALSIFVRDASDKFTLSKTFTSESTDEKITPIKSLAGASDVALSTDGQYLYVVGSEGNAVTIFSVGSEGKLTQAAVLDQAALGGHSLDVRSHLVSQGDYLYMTAAQTDSNNDSRSVLVFKRGTDGSLTSVSQTDNLIGASRLVLDPTGRYLFVSGLGDTVGVTGFSIDAEGKLTQVSQIRAEGEDLYYINSLALSPDGKTLYAIHADVGNYTLNTITVGADGALTLVSTVPFANDGGDSGEALATDLVVSADGTALFVIGKNISIFSRAEDGSLTLKSTISGDWNSPIGISFSDLQKVELSADGKQLYLIGGDKVHVLNIGIAGASYTEGRDATVLLPSGRLSDPQLDALNNGVGNYNGASITVSREKDGLPEDTFGFKADNGLTLDGNTLVKDGTAIATFTQVEGVLTVTFTAAVTKADAQNVLRQITYHNTSQDPEQAGSSPIFTFRINDGDNNIASMDITVNLVGVNDPAILTTTVLNPQIPGNSEFVKLFKDTHIDTIERGQTIWQVVLTFDVSGPNEVISVDGSTIVLEKSSGVPRTASGLQYSVDVKDGKATVLLYVARDASGTAAIIDSIGYNYLGSESSGERHVTLMIKENSYNGSAPETKLEQAITLTLAPAVETNTAPVITIPVTTPTYTERADPIVLAPEATVSDAQMDKLNGGKSNYDGATLKITLGDGKTALDKLGFSAGNGLTLSGDTLQKNGVTIGQISNQDGVLTIRFNANAGTIPTTEDVQNTLRQITYASDSHTPAAQVVVTVTLADRYLVSQDSVVTIGITQINDVPVINNDPVLSFGDLDRLQTLELSTFGLTGSTSSTVSADGSRVYIADQQGHIALFTRNADGTLTHMRTSAIASGVIQLQMTSDGANLYALQRNSSEGIIVTFALDSEGNLTEQSSLKQIWDAAQITLSDDGKNLYLMDRTTIIVYGRDTTTGALTHLQDLQSDMSSPPYLWSPTEVVTQGDKVYVVTNPSNGSSLIVYQRNSETGQLTPLTYLHSGEADSTGKVVDLQYVQHLSVSADGKTIFIANSRTSSFNGWTGENTVTNHPLKIDAFRLNAAGTLTHLGTLNGTATVEDISLSADDKTLYVALSDGSLAYYSADTLERIDTQNNLADAQKITVSPRGEIIILADALVVMRQTPLSAFYTNGGSAVAAVPTLILSDAELDAANGGAGDYRGASVVFQRSESPSSNDRFEMIAGNGFTVSGNVISKDGQPVATLDQADGRASVTFTASLSRDEATALVRQMGWRSTVVVNESSVALRVILNDGEQDSTPYEATVTISDSVNLPPVGHAELFTPPTAQVGSNWSYALPTGLFSDPENDTLTITINAAQLPNGVSFDSATRTLSGMLSTAGTFNVTITATDSAGNATALTVALTINAASTPVDPVTPVDPGTPTEPANPDNTSTAAPVILVQQGASLPADADEREREQPLGAIVADLSRPDAQPQSLPTSTTAEPARQRAADTTRPSDAPWVLDPVMSQLMPTLEQVNFSSRAEAAIRDSAAVRSTDSNLFLSVRGQTTALESAFSSVQGALLPDASGELAFSLPQRMFSVREGNAMLTLQLANGRPLPAWVQFDARSGVVRITDASAVQVNQIQLALKAQAADGTSRIVPITLQTGQGAGAEMATDRGAMQRSSFPTENREAERLAPMGKTAFTEQLHQHQPEQDALLAALSELSSLRA